MYSQKRRRDTRRERITSAPYTAIEVVVGSQIGIHRNIPEQDARTTHLTTTQAEKGDCHHIKDEGDLVEGNRSRSSENPNPQQIIFIDSDKTEDGPNP